MYVLNQITLIRAQITVNKEWTFSNCKKQQISTGLKMKKMRPATNFREMLS